MPSPSPSDSGPAAGATNPNAQPGAKGPQLQESDLVPTLGPGSGRDARTEFVDVFLNLWSEQRPGRGEDAPPLARATGPASGAVAVFDGLGGSGGAVVSTTEGEQSQARIAAVTARNVTEQFLLRMNPVIGAQLQAAGVLADDLCKELAAVVEHLRLGGGKLRSKLIRTLPTTVALARYERVDRGLLRCEAIWAGDSRLYVLTPLVGLQQLSEDDLRSRGDALENLQQDSPMSNLVSASGPFVLNRRLIELTEAPTVLIAATDGCFGYVPTPWHFEHLLLDAMRTADHYGGWVQAVSTAIQGVTGDDASMGLVVLGVRSFAELRAAFDGRTTEIADQVRRMDDSTRKLADARRTLVDAERHLEELRSGQWADYRPTFEHWFRTARKESTEPFSVGGRTGAARPMIAIDGPPAAPRGGTPVGTTSASPPAGAASAVPSAAAPSSGMSPAASAASTSSASSFGMSPAASSASSPSGGSPAPASPSSSGPSAGEPRGAGTGAHDHAELSTAGKAMRPAPSEIRTGGGAGGDVEVVEHACSMCGTPIRIVIRRVP